MTSSVKPIRKKSWLATCPLFLASLSLHGLGLLVMILIGDSGGEGSGISGSTGGDSFSVMWIPGDGRGKGKGIDTAVPDAEPGDSGGEGIPVESQPEEQESPLLPVAHRDPDAVFNSDSNDPLMIETEEKEAHPQQESITNGPSKSKTAQQNAVSMNSGGRIAAYPANASSPLETIKSSNSDDEALGSNRGGSEGRGRGGEAGGGGSSGAGGNRIDFFNIISRAKRVVYVIDASESMRQHNAMDLARQKLLSSLQELTPKVLFQIVFFNLTNHTMNRPGEKLQLLPATSINLRMAKQFLTGIQPDSGTDRLAAITCALNLEPDVIYLLTDADAPELSAKDLWDIRRINKRKALIHVVEFGVGSDMSRDSFLKKLTRQNNGMHYYHDLSKEEP